MSFNSLSADALRQCVCAALVSPLLRFPNGDVSTPIFLSLPQDVLINVAPRNLLVPALVVPAYDKTKTTSTTTSETPETKKNDDDDNDNDPDSPRAPFKSRLQYRLTTPSDVRLSSADMSCVSPSLYYIPSPAPLAIPRLPPSLTPQSYTAEQMAGFLEEAEAEGSDSSSGSSRSNSDTHESKGSSTPAQGTIPVFIASVPDQVAAEMSQYTISSEIGYTLTDALVRDSLCFGKEVS